MKILILHKIDYAKMLYHNGIDHDLHDVVYVGTAEKLKSVPPDLRCRRVVREDSASGICQSVLEALKASPGEGDDDTRPFDRIISLSEYELLAAAELRDALGVHGPSLSDARLVRDKVAMKKAVTAMGIDAPRFISLATLRSGNASLEWTGRTVLKPTHGAGSEDVVIFENASSAMAAIDGHCTGVAAIDGERPNYDAYELEEFVGGPIVHFDGLVRDGVVEAACGSRYIGTCQRYNENEPLGSYQIDLGAERLAWIQRVIEAVRIRVGAFHLEAIESERGLVFLEIGNRIGGAGVTQATSLAWGVDLQELELRLLVDECHFDLRQIARQGKYCGWYVVPGHRYRQGRWSESGAFEQLRSDARVIEWHERDPDAAFDDSPDYDLPSVPYGGIVGAQRSEDVRDYISGLFASLAWHPAA
ncbi:ATP-grasp domain-containing protein [Lysobacter brunescens]|uniref:Acetyl-CoA carboxylase biotin carboxylase subunit family protein n=1 Tax=Lysobacter brunescens TaxID=262323 RepID=A0A6B7LVJ8_9GAMM|nr:hypothetical protein [Lysobacter brunescens]